MEQSSQQKLDLGSEKTFKLSLQLALFQIFVKIYWFVSGIWSNWIFVFRKDKKFQILEICSDKMHFLKNLKMKNIILKLRTEVLVRLQSTVVYKSRFYCLTFFEHLREIFLANFHWLSLNPGKESRPNLAELSLSPTRILFRFRDKSSLLSGSTRIILLRMVASVTKNTDLLWLLPKRKESLRGSLS